jgi:hypothetical protein
MIPICRCSNLWSATPVKASFVAACFKKETTIHLSQSVKDVIESIITAITFILRFTNIAYYGIQLVW